MEKGGGFFGNAGHIYPHRRQSTREQDCPGGVRQAVNQHGNIIVAGGGLAGTLLSRFLVLEGFKITLYLDDLPAASHVAAGILHPVTGRRLVKSWMADTFIP